MAHLVIRLLGPFQADLDGEPLSGFASDKVRALLVYLSLSPDQPHRRETLAGLLWPDYPESSARKSLRNALANLRRVLRDRDAWPPFLKISRQTIQFDASSDHWLDAAEFDSLLGPDLAVTERLERAVSLAQGPLLEGFSLSDSAPFEEWLLLRREHYRRQLVTGLDSLCSTYESLGAHALALAHARRRAGLEPWQEAGQRQLLRLLALSGRRSEALSRFEAFRRSLHDELGAEPARETAALYKRIRDVEFELDAEQTLQAPEPAPATSPFLEDTEEATGASAFVARERELARLDTLLDLALTGRGQVAFVIGEVGSGKTALVREFGRRALDAHPDLIWSTGNCNAHTGVGDPYLPFREILEQMTGDLESKWAAGIVSEEQARRLWNRAAMTVETLAEVGPDLIGRFVSRPARLEREQGTSSQPSEPGAPLGIQQSLLYGQYTKLIGALARDAPLLLVVDDLQWADAGSIDLLFRLGRTLAGTRLLILGTYRPEDVALGRDGARHPLGPVVNELRRIHGDIVVNLDETGQRDLMEALLDREPNRLDASFRERLYQQTRGHPLFTTELLQEMSERGNLVLDPNGRWIARGELIWENVPARVEAVIAERIARLPEPLQEMLRVASVEGETFTAEVLASARPADVRDVVRQLSEELGKRHRLVRAIGTERLGSAGRLARGESGSAIGFGRRLSRYRFHHILFQRYLYGSIDEVEKAHLHETVGEALEELHGAKTGAGASMASVALQLARHFREAGDMEKAIQYLRSAGERAIQLSAYQEGLAHLTRALALLKALPDSAQRDQLELPVQLSLGLAWIGHKSYRVQAEGAFNRARELSEKLGETSELCRVLSELAIFNYVRAEYVHALGLAEEAFDLAQQAGDPLLVAIGHWCLGCIKAALGQVGAAHAHFRQVISFYRAHEHHRAFVLIRGSDVGASALAHDAYCLWCLGYPDQASKRSKEALDLAEELDHGLTRVDVLCFAGCVVNLMRLDAEALLRNSEELERLSANLGFHTFGATGTSYKGAALVQLGHAEDGIAHLRSGQVERESRGTRCLSAGLEGALVKGLVEAGRQAEGLAVLAAALAVAEETGECLWEAELHWLKARQQTAQGDIAGAEASYQKAIEASRQQRARSWELRAATGLARLWSEQDKSGSARRLLAPVYRWFSEGFSTPDLIEAKRLLDQLGS